MADRSVKVTLNANVAPYVSGMNQAAAATSKVDKAGQSIQQSSQSMAVGFAKAGAAAAVAGISLSTFSRIAKDSITAAGELQDSTAKVGVIFGKSADQIKAFADDSTKSFGLSRRAAYDATSTFAAMGKAAGLSGGELVKFSTDLTQRAVDLSSMYGGTVEQAITAVGSALRGESEPIRAYNVLLDDMTLRQQAVTLGLIDSVKEGLTPQTRAIAAQAEVMRQSSDAAGDYARNIDGYTNSAKEAAKAWEDAKAQFGETALPLATRGTNIAAESLRVLAEEGLGVIPVVGPWLRLALEDSSTAADGLGSAAANAATGVDALGGSAGGAAGQIATMDEQMRAAIGGLFGFIDAQQALAGSQQDLLGMEAELRESARQTTATRTGGSTSAAKSAKKSSDAERKAAQDVIDAIRKKDAAKQESEIKAARNAAQRKADARADAAARADVQAGVKAAIDADKAVRAGQDIDGKHQGGSVGEATGTLTKGEQSALDKKIDAIRARHKKALDAQLKGLRDATSAAEKTAKATGGTAKATDSYSYSLDANTEAGRRNLATISGHVDKVQANAQAVYDAAILDGKGADEAGKMARDALIKGYDAIMRSAESVGFATGEVKKYLAQLGLIPAKIETTFKVIVDADMTKAKAAYDKARAMFDGLGRKLTTDITKAEQDARAAYDGLGRKITDTRTDGQKYSDAIASVGQKRATGGEVYGPGSPTSDSVPIWASRGEYVVNAQQFAANADLVRAINNSTGRVSNGINIGAVNVTEASPSGVRQNVIDALAESAYRQGMVR
jgi:hypothetical protein